MTIVATVGGDGDAVDRLVVDLVLGLLGHWSPSRVVAGGRWVWWCRGVPSIAAVTSARSSRAWSANGPLGSRDQVSLEIVLGRGEVPELVRHHDGAEEARVGIRGIDLDRPVEPGLRLLDQAVDRLGVDFTAARAVR